jgi:phosphinothricin acetyltransferase
MPPKSHSTETTNAGNRSGPPGLLRDCTVHDAAPISAIYNHYVVETRVTFEETVVSASEMAQRMAAVTAQFPWLVWERDGTVLGYAYAMSWKARSAYRHSVETTIYLSPDARGEGIGTALYQSLFERLRQLSIHCAIGVIALPNPASVALHEKLGFIKAGHFHEIGLKFGHWIDVGYWELRLPQVGSDS